MKHVTAEPYLYQPHPQPGLPLMVVFSSVGAEAFHFFRLTKNLPCSRLYIRDPNLVYWYQHGLTPDGKLDDISDVIRKYREPGQDLYCVGSSMGGYAAIYFGLQLNARRVLAISPQIVLLPRLPRSPRRINLCARDLGPLLNAPKETEVNMIFGGNDLVDLFHAFKCNSDAPGVISNSVIDGGHFLAPKLNEGDRLIGHFADLLAGKPLDFSLHAIQPITAYDPELVQVICQFVPLYFNRKYDTAVECLLPYLQKFPDWALGQHWLGQAALVSTLYRERAAAASAKAVELQPAFPDFLYEAARVFQTLGGEAEARQYVDALLKLDPVHLHGNRLLKKLNGEPDNPA